MGDRPLERRTLIVGGLFAGLAWGAAMRAWMTLAVLVEGNLPSYDWVLTFVLILLPSTLIGGLYGWAESGRRSGGSPARRHAAWAPLLFVIIPFAYDTGFFATVLANGIGFGAVVVTIFGLAGGFALSGRGPRWARLLAGTLPAAGLIALGYGISSVVVPTRLEALPAMVVVLFVSLMVIWMVASTIPHRQ